ncbi:MAG: RNA methyltransferase [Burkholderiaceae bacterium]|nr:RNA methyltransferase [Burkholderiaceae bacterium]
MAEDAPRVVASASNACFRRLLALAGSSRERQRAGVVVLEGAHLLQAWAQRFGGDSAPLDVYAARRGLHDPEVCSWIARYRAQATVLDDRLFDRASGVEHGAGLLAIVPLPEATLPERLDEDAVYLDRVQDPGNVGSVLRSCAAVGMRRVLCAPGTASCWSPKVLRAAMGAHFGLAIHEGIDVAELQARCEAAPIATDAAAARSLYESDLRPTTLWLLGNEGQGLVPALKGWKRVHRVSIPQTEAVESLNVGVAAALCLYEQWRQRGFPGSAGSVSRRGPARGAPSRRSPRSTSSSTTTSGFPRGASAPRRG